MYLAQVRVQNFRNFIDFRASFSPGLNVIVGENNAGKTNLLDALRLALGSTSVGDPVRIGREDRHRRPDGSYSDKPVQIDMTFMGLSGDERAEFIDILNFDANNPSGSTAEVRYEWAWPESAKRWSVRRVGGGRTNSESAVPEEVLQAIPVTMLGALRDALVALSPGRSNRLAHLLRASATSDQQKALEKIIKKANDDLEIDPLVKHVEDQIGEALHGASGPTMRQEAVIRASEPEFDRIVANLRLVLKERGLTADKAPVLAELKSNGLGYNNLLYIATVLAALDAAKDATLPLLLVEEPEAHLHPQLQTLLADFLEQGGTKKDHAPRVQTIVTTHSPTLASHVVPNVIHVLHRDTSGVPRCVSLKDCKLDEVELKQLRRMLDVTKATMLFARGIVLVEGISEALLLPVLASRLGLRIADAGVSIVPLAGVDFATIGRLFGADRLNIPVAIITDGDPEVEVDAGEERPKRNQAGFHVCERVKALRKTFETNSQVSVHSSDVTLEYDLAAAGDANAATIFAAWVSCYARRPRALTKVALEGAASPEERALLLWRALCRGDPAHGKAELAQALAGLLEEQSNGEFKVAEFEIPKYIESGLRHALAHQDTGVAR